MVSAAVGGRVLGPAPRAALSAGGALLPGGRARAALVVSFMYLF